MKRLLTTILILGGIIAVAGPAFAKKPAGALISSAKIEIVSGDLARYKEAEALLKEAFEDYGPIAEGLFLLNQMQVDYMERTADLGEKRNYALAMVAYRDSLHMCCENKDIKKKFREDCDEFIKKADSTAVRYWREFFNVGVGQLDQLNKATRARAEATDSVNIAFYDTQIAALTDSTIRNLEIATIFDPNDYRPYVGISQAYESQDMYDSANVYLEKGLPYTEDKGNLLLPLAYNYINGGDYCKAIPSLREYMALFPTDTSNLVNLAICYNRCEQYDSARMTYREVLALDACNEDALLSIGHYFNQLAREANDSATVYRDAQSSAKATEWMNRRTTILDSSLVYFETAYTCDSTDQDAVENFGLIAFVQGKYETAIRAYSQLTTIDPSNKDAWLTLGDAHLQLRQFGPAIPAYEKVIELDPNNREIVERLVELHKEEKHPKEAARYQSMLDNMK
ncbi:MAG: tetratricopeptide repeat protein [candidate division Zixibacteria bacterium]|nr:tetratricopeptide repeat protein [candidate division Zixibacteria bacterium]